MMNYKLKDETNPFFPVGSGYGVLSSGYGVLSGYSVLSGYGVLSQHQKSKLMQPPTPFLLENKAQ